MVVTETNKGIAAFICLSGDVENNFFVCCKKTKRLSVGFDWHKQLDSLGLGLVNNVPLHVVLRGNVFPLVAVGLRLIRQSRAGAQ